MTGDLLVRNQSVLSIDGWLEFNRYKWGVKPLRVRLTEGEKNLPAVEAVLYLDKRGRIVQPPLNPYLPVVFYSTPTDKMPRLYRQWANLSKSLVEECVKRGVRGIVTFPPEVTDIRQWQWQGFLGEVRYTFYIDLPYDLGAADNSKRRQVNKARMAGFACEIATRDSLSEVVTCLMETEARQRFTHRLGVQDLEAALNLVGEENLRIYVCKFSTGEVASAWIAISAPGMRAIGWVAGTKLKFLNSWSNQLVTWFALSDLARQGATGFDFGGSNLPTVSAAKAEWGGKLVPYYAVRPLNLRTLGALGLKMLKQRGKRGI